MATPQLPVPQSPVSPSLEDSRLVLRLRMLTRALAQLAVTYSHSKPANPKEAAQAKMLATVIALTDKFGLGLGSLEHLVAATPAPKLRQLTRSLRLTLMDAGDSALSDEEYMQRLAERLTGAL